VSWTQIVGAGILGGIGFTMSIFITNLAFQGEIQLIATSKLAILCASMVAGAVGYLLLRSSRSPSASKSSRESIGGSSI
jgi:Na+:H+ antiporter, NhaA family